MRKRSIFTACLVAFVFFLCSQALAGHGGHERPEKRGILLAAFGTTVSEARVALENVEEEVRKAFPDLPVRWAYTSHMVRRRLAGQGVEIDSLETALARMMDEGFTHVAVQSLHTIGGWEFHDLVRNARAFSGMAGGFDRLVVGGPLLNGREDIGRTAEVLLREQPDTRKPGEALVFMGHGTDHPADALYTALAVELRKRDPDAFLGTVEGSPGIEEIRGLLTEREVSRAYLVPFMAVAGDHARNDLAGEGEDSWKSVLSRAGVECVPVLRGTAELDPMVAIWVDHLRSAMKAW
ncbi:MAG: sirohydrochlorin cobaltochelatase [Deltaproteobacteria bacterium]|nr:sirohydrochlorin cobaltochelatase [Deltaproteobacteria bacterium]